MKKYLALLVVGVFIIACKKNNPSPSSTTVYLPSSDSLQYGHASSFITVYTYDNNNRISIINTLADAGSTEKFSLSYDGQDRVTEMDYQTGDKFSANIASSEVYKFTYTATAIAEQDFVVNNNVLTPEGNKAYTLDNSGKVVKLVTGANDYLTYTYDNTGNVNLITTYHTASSNLDPAYTNTAAYTYDNNKSAFTDIKGNYYIFRNEFDHRHNILTEKDTYSQTNTTGNSSYQYTLNSHNYPASETIVDAGIPQYVSIHHFAYLSKNN